MASGQQLWRGVGISFYIDIPPVITPKPVSGN